jgi:hypothetical protein
MIPSNYLIKDYGRMTRCPEVSGTVKLCGLRILNFVRYEVLTTRRMKMAVSSEMSVNTYQTVWCYNPEECHHYFKF